MVSLEELTGMNLTIVHSLSPLFHLCMPVTFLTCRFSENQRLSVYPNQGNYSLPMNQGCKPHSNQALQPWFARFKWYGKLLFAKYPEVREETCKPKDHACWMAPIQSNLIASLRSLYSARILWGLTSWGCCSIDWEVFSSSSEDFLLGFWSLFFFILFLIWFGQTKLKKITELWFF